MKYKLFCFFSFSGRYYSNTMFGVICTIACLASTTSAQLKYNQSRRDSWDNVRNYLTRGDFSDIDLANLMRVLNLISNSEEFQPLKISIGTLGTNSNLSGQISKFFELKLITSYQIDLDNDLSMSPIANFHHTTWIIVAEHPQLLDFNCKWSKLIFNSRNKFLIIFLQRQDATILQEDYEKLFSKFWKRHGITKILIGAAKDHFEYFYRYLPFEINKHGFGKMQKIFINQENSVLIQMKESDKGALPLKKLRPIFEDFMNLNNYPINVTVFKSQMLNISKIGNKTSFSGLDVNAMLLLKNVLNADFQITALSNNYKSDPFESGLQRIESGEADLIMTMYFVKPYEEFKSFDFTIGVHLDKLCLFGKAAGKVPKSFMPFLPISLDFWPLFIIYNILISVFWFMFKNLSNRIHQNSFSNSHFQNLLTTDNCQMSSNQTSELEISLDEEINLNVYPPEIDYRLEACGTMTIMSFTHLHGAETIPQRFFLSGTLFFTIIILGLYESTLLSALRKPFEYSELHTLNDVLSTNYPILTKYQNLKDNTFYEQRLKDRVVVLHDVKDSLRSIIVRNKSVLGIMRLSTADLEDRTNIYDESGEYLLHVIEECPAEYSLSYIVRRFSPYLERINKILPKVCEGGFIFKWYNDMQYPIYKEEQKRIATRPLISVLTLEHYSLSFFILLGAFLCSTLVFIAEILFARSARFKKYTS